MFQLNSITVDNNELISQKNISSNCKEVKLSFMFLLLSFPPGASWGYFERENDAILILLSEIHSSSKSCYRWLQKRQCMYLKVEIVGLFANITTLIFGLFLYFACIFSKL